MEHRVFILAFAALVLVTFSRAEGWTKPDFCHGCDCPEYSVVKNYTDFQERKYVESRWITTNITDLSLSVLMGAKSRLEKYCSDMAEDCEIIRNAWPAVITVTEEDGSESLTASWFVPPNAKLSKDDNNNNSEVKQETRPAASVYVRSFDGTPNEKLFRGHAKQLRDDLEKAKKSYEPKKFIGAAYNKLFDLVHYDEIWISATK